MIRTVVQTEPVPSRKDIVDHPAVSCACFKFSRLPSRAPLPRPKGALSNHWPATSFETAGITSIVKLVLNMRDHTIFIFGEIAARGI